jgi:hypothetical protein
MPAIPQASESFAALPPPAYPGMNAQKVQKKIDLAKSFRSP